jgi:hypothetical protein
MNARVDVTKQKDGDLVKGMHFDLNRHVLGNDDEGDEVSSLIAEFHDSVASIRKNHRGGKYEQHILKMLGEKGACTESELRHGVKNVFNISLDAASMGVRRTVTDLKNALRIQETTSGAWTLAD